MKTAISKAITVVSLCAASLSGCATSLGPVDVWRSALACQPESAAAGARLVTSLPERSAVPVSGQFAVEGKAPAQPVLDAGFHYLRIDMGMKPTGGYGLKLLSETLELEGDVAGLGLQWVSPAEDAITAQVINYPCIVLKIPKGDYSVIKLRDEHGAVRHAVDVKAQSVSD